MSIHTGSHLIPLQRRLQKRKIAVRVSVAILALLTSIYGVCAFFRRGFPGYMFGTTAFAFFDYSEPPVFFLLDYLAVMVLFSVIGMLIGSALSGKTKAARHRRGSTQS